MSLWVTTGELTPSNTWSGLLPHRMQLVSVGDDSLLTIAPPMVPAEFPQKVQLVSAGEQPVLFCMPPP